ncbi:hypothetical protein [Mycobacterium sp. GA-2829]|uniref:hypothetical protein n=1 Tax=Mycobacterium sp. GA-2829 TaxID=1772283 RepID=UPI00073FB8D2|nr:hypothetical protein [Mycobacterium sp. GA-2829]KUI27601.1 hypothetical protein AU194_02940 [Mycobacterium sp. GA-2829]
MGGPGAPPGWTPGAHTPTSRRRADPRKAIVAVLGAVVLTAALLAGGLSVGTGRDREPVEHPASVGGSITATPTVVQEGWGVRAPTRAAREAMWEWVTASSGTLDTATEVTRQVRPQVQDAIAARDAAAIKFYCSQMLAPITVEMSGIVDTPDPDLTRALQTVVESARDVEGRCAVLPDPPDQTALDALHTAFGQVASDLDAMVRIVDRDATIMARAGR